MRRSIDAHAHVGYTVATGIGQSVDELRERMARSGISQSLLSPAAANRQADGIQDTRRMNDTVAEAVRRHPQQFPAGLGLVEPRHEELAVRETVRVLDELGLVGIAAHPVLEGYYIHEPLLVDPIFEVLDDHAALCLMHSSPSPDSGESPGSIRVVAEKFQAVQFVLGHAFLTRDQLSEALRLAHDLPNIFLDVAYQCDPHLTAQLVGTLGASRVVFGTDQPFFDPEAVLGSVLDAEISDDERDAVLYGNLSRLLESRS